jgi:hypothetical protein
VGDKARRKLEADLQALPPVCFNNGCKMSNLEDEDILKDAGGDDPMFNGAMYKDPKFAYGLAIVFGLIIILGVFSSYNSFSKKKSTRSSSG